MTFFTLLEKTTSQKTSEQEFPQQAFSKIEIIHRDKNAHAQRNYIRENFGAPVLNFISKYIDFSNKENLVTATTTRFNILNLPVILFQKIANLKRINDIRFLNKFFETVNLKLKNGGIFIGYVETKNQRKRRIFRKFPKGFNLIYYSLDFILKRVFPKLPLTKKIYFILTRGNNRVLTRAETLGRLYASGFKILQEEYIDGHLYFVAQKVKEPLYPFNPTYGPLIRLKRVGLHGKIIKIYKLRTMHPFAEYLQNYVYKKNNLQKCGKFNKDFRVSTLGHFFRKCWIDELPMLINFFRGDLKLVGVRPLSRHYFNLYDDELKQMRIQFKPGLVPPFYADLPKSFDEIMDSEKEYLNKYKNAPLKTDWKYFWKAFFNIVFKRARSK